MDAEGLDVSEMVGEGEGVGVSLDEGVAPRLKEGVAVCEGVGDCDEPADGVPDIDAVVDGVGEGEGGATKIVKKLL